MNSLNKFSRYILDIFFPNRCPFCDKFICWDKLACDECIDKLPYVDEKLCKRCGKSPCICSDELNYDICYAACTYNSLAREGIINLKVKNAINAAEFFADILSKKIIGSKEKYDMIIPVPMSRKKKIIRGYNQADEIAKFLSKKTKIPICKNILAKFDSDIEQHTLNAKQRIENAKMEFSIKTRVDLKGKSVLICDDVITTGSTLNECARLIKQLGADKVAVSVCSTTILTNQ